MNRPGVLDGPSECDAPYPSLYIGADGQTHCTCIVCARCGKHTGNGHQGHYWSWCQKTGQTEGLHFCCPDLPCEYEPQEELS